MKYKIRFTPHGINTDVNDVDCGNHLFITINFTTYLKSVCYTYQYQNNTIKRKINKLTLVYFNLYTGNNNIFNKLNLNQTIIHPFPCNNITEAFIYSYASYIVFIDLINNTNFSSILPFTFNIPCTLTDGDAASYQTLHYFLLPLTILLKLIEERWLKDYINVLIYFINNYSSLFPAGAYLETEQLTIDTLGGLTDYLIKDRCLSTSSFVDNSFIYKEKQSSNNFEDSTTTYFENTSKNNISDISLLYNKDNTSISYSTSTLDHFDQTSENNVSDMSLLYKNKCKNTTSTEDTNTDTSKNDVDMSLLYKKYKNVKKSELSSSSFNVINTFKYDNELIWHKK